MLIASEEEAEADDGARAMFSLGGSTPWIPALAGRLSTLRQHLPGEDKHLSAKCHHYVGPPTAPQYLRMTMKCFIMCPRSL